MSVSLAKLLEKKRERLLTLTSFTETPVDEKASPKEELRLSSPPTTEKTKEENLLSPLSSPLLPFDDDAEWTSSKSSQQASSPSLSPCLDLPLSEIGSSKGSSTDSLRLSLNRSSSLTSSTTTSSSLSTSSSSSSSSTSSSSSSVVPLSSSKSSSSSRSSCFDLDWSDDDDDLSLSSDDEEPSLSGQKRKGRAWVTSSSTTKKIKKEPTAEEPFLLGKDQSDTEVLVPGFLAKVLFPHQRVGVQFLFDHYLKGCILGDDMGLGKTIQVIAFLAAICEKREGINQPSKKKILVVVPASVIAQWEKEILKFGMKSFHVCIYHGSSKQFEIGKIRSGYADLMITSYGMLQRELDLINQIKWTCAVFDEVHKIKDRTSKVCKACNELSCEKRIGLTGTMMQNNFEELWCLLHWARPGALGGLDDFRMNFINVIKAGQKREATLREIADAKDAAKTLSETIVGTVVLRRDKRIISHLLPQKKDHIVFCPLTPLQKRCYSRVMQCDDVQALRAASTACECASGKTKGTCCHRFDDNTVVTSALFFYMSKIIQLSSHLCLLKSGAGDAHKRARDEMFLELAYDDDEEEITQLKRSHKIEDLCELSGKMKVLVQLLPIWRKEKKKVLIFSQSTTMLDIMETVLRTLRYHFCRLDGSVPVANRQRIAEDFNTNPSLFVFLLSTKAGGLGLNLVSASVVVVFDPSWNQTWDLQAQDRAYRIGQTKDTMVFRLISEKTIEEKQYQRQVYKQQLDNVGLQNQHQRRYFSGVQGVKGQEGELFGTANLFADLEEEKNGTTTDILDRTQKMYQSFRIAETTSKPTEEQNEEPPGHMNSIFGDQTKSSSSSSLSSTSSVAGVLQSVGAGNVREHNTIVGEATEETFVALKAARVAQEERLQNLEKIVASEQKKKSKGISPHDAMMSILLNK